MYCELQIAPLFILKPRDQHEKIRFVPKPSVALPTWQKRLSSSGNHPSKLIFLQPIQVLSFEAAIYLICLGQADFPPPYSFRNTFACWHKSRGLSLFDVSYLGYFFVIFNWLTEGRDSFGAFSFTKICVAFCNWEAGLNVYLIC